MTDFDFTQIITVDAEGDVCGPDGCLPAEGPHKSVTESVGDGQNS